MSSQTKKAAEANKKQKRSHYSEPVDDSKCLSTDGEFGATVVGRPLPFKRPGFGPNNRKRYNPNKTDQEAFVAVLETILSKHHLKKKFKEDQELEATIVFRMPEPKTKAGKITGRPDLDNLTKFVLDALQKGQFLSDDSQITRLVLEKRFDTNFTGGATSLLVRKRPIDID
jgi:Holliday junction resolvase RusA-like endonuclease